MTELHSAPDDASAATEQDGGAPACVLCFNASEPTGAAGLGADIATIAAMGAEARRDPALRAGAVDAAAALTECSWHRCKGGGDAAKSPVVAVVAVITVHL